MKYVYVPVALIIAIAVLAVYLSAALVAAIFGTVANFFKWVMDSSERVIARLERWSGTV